MYQEGIHLASQIIDVVKLHESGNSVEDIVDELNLPSKDVFKVVFNYRFCFKKLNELSNKELWALLETEVPTGR